MQVVLSAIETYGDTIHVFVEKQGEYGGVFLLDMRRGIRLYPLNPLGSIRRSHGRKLGWGEMNTWVDFYAPASGICPAHLLR